MFLPLTFVCVRKQNLYLEVKTRLTAQQKKCFVLFVCNPEESLRHLQIYLQISVQYVKL